MKKYLFRETKTTPAHQLIQASRLLAACALLLVQSSWSAWADGRQYLHNTVPAAVGNAKMVRPSLRLEKLNLTIGLPLRNLETLTNELRQIYDPASPNFHHYLTVEQFTEKFGPTEKDYEAVLNFAHAHGLTVTDRHPNRMLVSLRGTVGDIERAFHVSLNEYKHPTEARTFRAPNAEPSLDLAAPVLSIGGLDNYFIPHPCLKPAPTNTAPANPGANGTPAAGSGPSGNYLGKDWRAAYAPGVTNTGTGQSVGLFELESGYYQSDITAYETAAGLPNVPVTPVLLDGYTGGPGQGNDEVSLDIEMAISMAPGLSGVFVYEGSTVDDILNRMATDNSCKQLSASWTYTTDATTENIFLEFAAQGQSFFNASGDGDADVGAPDTPTDDPNITVVGGTTLTTTGPAGAWTGETVWNSSTTEPLGTGGGISTRHAIPAWQQGINMTTNQGSTIWRNLPDVAMVANNVWVYYGNGSSGSFVGTSCATPAWAAFIALANQTALANGQPTVGFINPALYNIGKGSNSLSYASAFHDVTSGNNEWTSSPTKFVAAPGYDLCTGWGSPAGSNLLIALALPEPLRITPFAGAVFSGPVGGPFIPSVQSYTLTNNGGGTLNWALSAPPAWLDVSPTSGTLLPGGPATTVVVGIDPSATNFAAGAYTTVIAFTNLSDNFVQPLPATLAVVTPPVITSQPTNEALLAGQTAIFSVGIASNALAYYQWQKNGANLTDTNNIAGSATASLTLSAVSSANVASYSVIVSNAAGVASSSNALLSLVSSAPVITLPPTNLTVLPGAPASFTVAVVGNTPYSYRWYFNGATNVGNAAKVSLTNSTLSITNAAATNVGSYSVIITNSLGSVTSSVAILSLTPVTAPGYGLILNASFAGGTSVENPYSAVVYDGGSYYGTSFNGGADGGGCTYSVTAAGVVTRKHSFTGGTDGAFPVASLCLGRDGDLYGVCYQYGTYDDGCLWKEVPSSASVSALVQFNGDNGSEPVAGLMQAADNLLYGAANVGGAYGYGTIFRCATNATALTTLASFDGTDGAFPSPVLVQGTDGYLYGTAENGGAYESGAGTVFRISTNGALTVLYSFNGTNDGAVPIAGLIQAVDGNFYGTTLLGGALNEGTVFQITTSGVLTTLYSFTGGTDGAQPWGGLVQAANGNLYGTTQQGGTYGDGTVFQIAPTGPLTTIAELDGFQGATPEANLVQGPDGNLYGTAFSGGYLGNGTFFSITNYGLLQITGQPLSESVYSGANALFTVATSGSAALAYRWQQNGTNLTNGGGISGASTATLVISNVAAGNAALYTVIVTNAFNSVTSMPAMLTVMVSQPIITGQPVSSTNVVGTMATFSVSATGDGPLLYEWQENGTNLTDGGNISGSTMATLTINNLVVANSGYYSVIVSNALTNVVSSNALLTVVPANLPSVAFTNLHLFAGGTSDGTGPDSALIQGKDGNLYGTASSGGSSYEGTIFRSSLTGTLTDFYSFSGAAGSYPNGGLIQTLNGNFYGTAQQGGANGDGALFRITNSTTVSLLYSFAGTADGQGPVDSLVQGVDGNFYGTAFAGGTYTYGSVFQVLPSGTVNLLYGFTGIADGANPVAGLVQGSDGNFYGTTTSGGAYGYGTAFSLNTNGALTILASFNYTNGAVPLGGLVQANDGSYYGTTAEGGVNGYGTVFRLSTNSGLATLYSFAGADGESPEASLTQGNDGNLYGTTYAGGIAGQGTVFLITTNGGLRTLLSFNGFNGSGPESALVQASDGNFYGTTFVGGNGYAPSSGGGNGTIFRITVPTFISGAFTLASAVAALPYMAVITNLAVAPAGDTLAFAMVSGPGWLNVASNGVLSGTPANSDIGTNDFVVSLTDTNGVTASASMSLAVIADPPPTFISNPFTEPSANPGEAYTGSISTNATAPYISAGDILTFAVVSGPAWLAVTTNGMLTGTPAVSDSGTNTFVVSVTDLGGSSNTASLIIYVTPATPPVITVPATITVQATNAAGNVVFFSVTATDAVDGVLSPVVIPPSGSMFPLGTTVVTARATDSLGLSATNSFLVIVQDTNPPVIIVPATITVQATNAAGNVVFFSVTATDAVDGVISPLVIPPSGSTFPLGTTVVTARATDSLGLSATNSFLVIVQDTNPPVIISQPASRTNYAGTSASFTVVATNVYSPLSYQWSFGTNMLAGETNSTLNIASVDPTNAGDYEVIVSNQAGSTNSLPATLTVIPPAPPIITVPATIAVQPTNTAGNVVFFSVTAIDAVDGMLAPLVIPPSGSTFPLGTNLVTATATNSIDLSATNTFLIIVQDTNPPVIVSQPASLTNYAGTSASFTVGATAYSPLSYQWFFGTNALAGQTNSALTLASVGPADVGYYQVTVSSQGGSTNSLPATLTVIYQAPNLLGGSMLGTNGFRFSFFGPPGQTYEVLASDDLTLPLPQWAVVGTGAFGGTNVVFTDPNATNSPNQFYIIESP
jgi:uncharacterized repeat protein (TIGR03803 family)